jgi:hypothetical protein
LKFFAAVAVFSGLKGEQMVELKIRSRAKNSAVDDL